MSILSLKSTLSELNNLGEDLPDGPIKNQHDINDNLEHKISDKKVTDTAIIC